MDDCTVLWCDNLGTHRSVCMEAQRVNWWNKLDQIFSLDVQYYLYLSKIFLSATGIAVNITLLRFSWRNVQPVKVSGKIFGRQKRTHYFLVASVGRGLGKGKWQARFHFKAPNLVPQYAEIIYDDIPLFSIFTDFLKARSGLNDLCFSTPPITL